MPGKTKSQANPAPFLSQDSEACFTHYSKLLAASPPEPLEQLNADPDIIRVNVNRGVDAVRPHLDDVKEKLPKLDLDDFLELPSIALALGFAVNRIFTPASPKEIHARQARMRPSRALTLSYLEIAGPLGLVPSDRVKAIRANSGPLDEAHDAVAIVAVFGEYADALKNKHPFSAELLAQLAEDGNWLVQQLTPKGAMPGKSERSEDAIVRDRIWTDLVRRYDELYQAGVVVWGRRKVEQHIPPLHSRAAASPPATPTPPAVAPATPAGAPAPEKPVTK
jgi:hypothetical protein